MCKCNMPKKQVLNHNQLLNNMYVELIWCKLHYKHNNFETHKLYIDYIFNNIGCDFHTFQDICLSFNMFDVYMFTYFVQKLIR